MCRIGQGFFDGRCVLYNLGQAIASHDVNEPPGEFWLAASTLHAVPILVVMWQVEFPTYPDVAVGFVVNL